MSTVYRKLDPSEYPEAVRLWVEVFEVEAAFFETLLAAGENFSVGAFVDDKLVSSVHVFYRWVRNLEGVPQKMGGIGSVSTHPDHRKAGHSGRLLRMVIEEMEAVGCAWSYLGTGVNDHYARYGWRTFSTLSWKVALPESPLPAQSVRTLGTSDEELAEMIQLYEAASKNRPLSYVRTPEGWHTAIRFRIRFALGYPQTGPLEGYLVGRQGDGDWNVVELAGSDNAVKALTTEFARLAQEAGKTSLVYCTPKDVAECAPWSTGAPLPVEGRYLMSRPIGATTDAEVAALVHDIRSRHPDLDSF